jgi:PIN domain nuclease of toxin-antitoxin system
MKLVLDTHAALWWAISDPRIGSAAARRMQGMTAADLAISDVTLSELARIIRDPRKDAYIKVGRLAWLTAFTSGFTVVPVSASIADLAANYAFDHRDPCDRHILATSETVGLPLVTVDEVLTKAAQSINVRVLW